MTENTFVELGRGEYRRAAALLGRFEHDLAVKAVMDGSAPARVYVDEAASPQIALAWRSHRIYLAGPPDTAGAEDALTALFAGPLARQAQIERKAFYILYYEPQDWAGRLPQALAVCSPAPAARQYWEFDLAGKPIAKWRGRVPPGFAVRSVDEALLAEEGLGHLDELKEELCSERPTTADFLARSFGVCLVTAGHEIAGWCLSEYNTGERCEVGIETVEDYRRRGFGTLLTQALLKQAAVHGVRYVGWHCFAANAGSGATAARAGLRKLSDYGCFWGTFPS